MPCCRKEEEPEPDACLRCANIASNKDKKSKKQSALPRPVKPEKSKAVTIQEKPIVQVPEPPSLHRIFLKRTKSIDRPVPYTFRVPVHLSPAPRASLPITRPAKSPPFYLQLDHLIAVIWCLFSPDKKDKCRLGITQLQWALYLLRTVRMPNGDYLPDIAIAIRAIEDKLIECYAEMSNVVMQMPIKRTNCMTCDLRRTLPRSKCDICSSATLGVVPRRSHRTLPSDAQAAEQQSNLSHYGTYRRRVNLNQQITSVSPSTQDSSEHVRNDIRRLKVMAAALTKEQMMSEFEQDIMMDQLQEWHKEKLGKLREEMDKLRRMEHVFR